MSSVYDVILIGSGHNGLVAAGYLAKAGKKVLVLERSPHFGGGVVTKEIVAPGFRHDLHSASHIFIQANPLLRNDELGLKSKYGLEYVNPDGVFSTIFPDHTYVVSYHDVDKTCESFARISPRDAEAYRKFAQASLEVVPLLIEGMFVPPPPQGAFFAMLDQSAMGRNLLQTMQRSILDIVNEHFEHEKIKLHFLRFAAELFVSPDEKGYGGIIFYMPGMMHSFKPGLPVGGSGALVDALVRCLVDNGAEMRADTPVAKVLVEGGKAVGVRLASGEEIRARDCVIGQIHPWNLPSMVDDLDPQVAYSAKRTNTSAFAVMSGHYAFTERPKYTAGDEPGRCMMTGFAPATVMEYRRTFDSYRDGKTSPVMTFSAHTQCQFDATRAPAGQGAVTTWRLAPFELDGMSWDDYKAEAASDTLAMLRHYAPNLNGDTLIAHQFDTPLDMQRYSPTFQRGDVNGLGKYFYQLNGHRPTPELSQYAVPGAEGLYLAGTFMHPPGGVTGGGRATAIKICGDLGIEFDKIAG
jgi:phytoene dehydrogenase-like protein